MMKLHGLQIFLIIKNNKAVSWVKTLVEWTRALMLHIDVYLDVSSKDCGLTYKLIHKQTHALSYDNWYAKLEVFNKIYIDGLLDTFGVIFWTSLPNYLKHDKKISISND